MRSLFLTAAQKGGLLKGLLLKGALLKGLLQNSSLLKGSLSKNSLQNGYLAKFLVVAVFTFSLFVTFALSFSAPVFAGQCKVTTAEGWGPTEGLAKLQATDMLLLSTGNLIVQSDKFSKPEHSCTFTLLGWTCKATAKVCKK